MTYPHERADQDMVPRIDERHSDSYARTKDGKLVFPGMKVYMYNTYAYIRKIYDGGEYGHCVELENADGPQGWAPLSECFSNRRYDLEHMLTQNPKPCME